MARPLAIGLALVLLAAAASLLLPYMPVYDPFGWLVWGRELAHLDLATAAGPSWKPLPVFVNAPLSLFGGAAPDAWLLIARAGWLAAPLLAAFVTAALAADAGRWRWLGALLAAASVLLSADAFTPAVRQFTGGLSEGLLVAIVMGAVLTALAGKTRATLWLGVAASLLRPECWPFLALWAWREVRRRPELRSEALVAALLIPLAWFLPDLVAAGSPLEGSETARQGGLDLDEIRQVAERALTAPLAAVWIGVGLFLYLRRSGQQDRPATVLLLGACAWVALVAAMAVIGFAGLPRFLAPASAVFAAVGGVGVARAAARAEVRGLGALAALAVALATVGFGLRAAELPGDIRRIDWHTRSQENSMALADRLGEQQLFACGHLRITSVLAQTTLAWHLERPIGDILIRRRPTYGMVLSFRPQPGGVVVGRVGNWWATRFPCRR